MRATLTLDPDVSRRLRAVMAERKISQKKAVNEALRAGLAKSGIEQKVRFSVEPHACRFKAGVDPDKLNQLADELAAEESVNALSR